MVEEARDYKIECLRVEKGSKKGFYKFVFGSDFGEYPIEERENYFPLFRPGKKYLGVLKAGGISDFLVEEDKMENLCTFSYSLEKIILEGDILWTRKN
jgi:hypothetical protein